MYIITPNDQISQLLSYFSEASTSGAEMRKFQYNAGRLLGQEWSTSDSLTNVIWRITWSLQCVRARQFSEPKISQF